MYQKYLNLELLGTGYCGYKHGLLCQSGSNINIEKVNQITLSHYGKSFETLCSEHKFKHFWEEFTNPLNAELPVESIIKSAGFNSNNDFAEIILKHKEESKYILEKKLLK